MIAGDRETHQRDLYEAIERGEFPRWKFCVQVMPESRVGKHWYNPFDLTKVWPHKDYPLIEVGMLELNRNPDNYFAEVEQAALSPANVVPGIGHSPDKMLQARIFSYADAHRYRVGVNARAAAGQQAALPGAHLPSRRRDAARRQSRTRTPITSRTRSAGPAQDKRVPRAAAEDLGRCRPLQSPRRQ